MNEMRTHKHSDVSANCVWFEVAGAANISVDFFFIITCYEITSYFVN